MPKKLALASKKIVVESDDDSEPSDIEQSPSPPQTPARKKGRAQATPPRSSTTRKTAASSAKASKKSKAHSPSPSPSSSDQASDNNSNPDEYASDVLASSSSGDEEDDVFDPEGVSDVESETGNQGRPKRVDRRTGSTTTGGSSRAETPLESELDEEDEDIGLNYHAKSVSPKKRPSVSPAKRKSISNTKNGKRKRNDYYSDIESSNSEEEDEEEIIVEAPKPKKAAASKKTSTKSASAVSKKATPSKPPAKKRKKKDDSYAENLDEDESDTDRFTVVGKIVQAPTTGRVPPGQISKNTLNFLAQLAKPECNDREWFKLNEPVFRLAEKEWKAFLEELVPLVSEMDEEIPPLPPNDIIHRIYRDVRFSNDKTPYKRNFSASMSRTGRKGKFAGYHISIRPGGSLLAAGVWAPEKDELANFRANVQRNPTPLRDVISAPAFVKLFGEAKPHPKGQRRNVFGNDDQLKVAPKGVSKDHPDIDLLKLRSVAVVHQFSDKEVLKPDFNEEVVRVMAVVRPLVHLLNDMVSLPPEDEDEDEE